ncbi:MAG: type I secretion system permease/ATPase [Alphaproteobacteria bacterium]
MVSQIISPNFEASKSEQKAPNLDTGLIALVMIGRFFERPADPFQIKHSLGKGELLLSEIDILRAAKLLDLKAKAISSDFDRIASKTPLPCIAQSNDGEWFIIGRAAEDKILIHKPGQKNPEIIAKEAFMSLWSGRLILFTSRKTTVGGRRRFDVSWFIPAVVKYRRLFAEVLLASFFLQLFALVSPLLFQVIIDKVLVHHGRSTLDVIFFALLSIAIFESVLGALRTYVFSHTTNRIDVELGTQLFRHLTGLPLAYFGARRVGDTVARVRELENIRSFLTGSALTLVIDLAFTFVFFTVMFYYAPILSWIVVGSIPFYVVLSLLISPLLHQRVETKFKHGAENQAFLVETITGIETVKAMALEPQSHRRWEEQLAAYVASSFKVSNLGNVGQQTIRLIQKATSALTLFFGAKLVMDNSLSVGQLVAFNMLAGNVSSPILRLAQVWQDFQQVRISIDRLGDILNNPPEPSVETGRAPTTALKGHVVFENVSFRYDPSGSRILSDIKLDIMPGETIGIVGSSGSGKSTLTKLIQRLYIPEQGRIMVDDIDISTADPAWLRRQIGVVLQENMLFNRSVRDNIAITNPSVPMERVIEASKLAGAHSFIAELSDGYDTIIGERGTSLSGGQRQRIAIARALLTNPRILIFDEATSALDYESEKAIQDNMEKICQGRTMFIIAHRLSTVRSCSRIIVIERGEIVEIGSHKSLLKSGGRYANLWRCQTDDAVKEVSL